jgi:menaquinone-specific isochorismate synthase
MARSTRVQADRALDEPLLREAALRAKRLARPVLASWTRQSSIHDAIGFFAQAEKTADRVLWLRPSSGDALVGVGAAQVLTGRGTERFKQVSAAWRDLLSDAVVDDASEAPDGGPLLIGGFSFDPLRPSRSSWKAFTEGADARVVLPERVLVLRGGSAWLTTNVVVNPAQWPPDRSRHRAPALDWGAPAEPAPLSPNAWKALTGSVARGIRHGQLGIQKVVLARAYHVQHSQPIDPVAAVRQLAASYPSCTVFAVGHRAACFLGATPERLIALHHGTAVTMALAGSIARGATPAEDQALAEKLLHDPKERAEHAVVVGALRDGLAQVSTRIMADAQPRVHKLANLQHLLTPIRGQVSPGVSVLDLVERLHPTPAMGGFPRQPALELIRASEGLDRGWYAGPIGWLNRDGEGEFVVGIRSALVQGDSATLFAGCGIVAESNAAAEFAESEWKLRPMLAALGLG